MSQGGKKGQKVTTGKQCDGCGEPRGRVKLTPKYVTSFPRFRLDFCPRCLRLDAEENGEIAPPCVEARPTVAF